MQSNLTFDDAYSGDPSDDVSVMGQCLYKEYSRRFSTGSNPNDYLPEVLMNLLFAAHRAEPGSTEKLVDGLQKASEYIQRDRDFVIKNQLPGYEKY